MSPYCDLEIAFINDAPVFTGLTYGPNAGKKISIKPGGKIKVTSSAKSPQKKVSFHRIKLPSK